VTFNPDLNTFKPDLNFPTLDKLAEPSGQAGARWLFSGEGGDVDLIDCFGDAGASPISNERMEDWINDGLVAGVPFRQPHMLFNSLRDNEYPLMLGERLGLGQNVRVFYSNSGQEAVETAIKTARRATGRGWVLGLPGDFHGRSLANLSIQDGPEYHHKGFGYPNPQMGVALGMMEHGAVKVTNPHWGQEAGHGEREISPRQVAALVISPLNGNNTLEEWPEEVWAMAKVIREAGGVIIFDEVQTGFGRVGGVPSIISAYGGSLVPMNPDIWCFGKAAGAGWPFSITVTRGDIGDVMDHGSHFNTMAGSPMGCYLSKRLIEELEGGMLSTMLDRARDLVDQFGSKGLYNYGYMMAIRTDDPKGLCARAREEGLLLITARDTLPVRFTLPYDISTEDYMEVTRRLTLCL